MKPILLKTFLLTVTIVAVMIPGCKSRDAKNKAGVQNEIKSNGSKPISPTASIHDAAYNGNLGLVSSLLENGCRADTTDNDGRTPLMYAAFNGHTIIVKRLIDSKASLNLQDINGRTALMMASSGPFPETVKLLLSSGADPNITDKAEHFSALMYAGSEGQLEVVKILLANNANPYLKDIDGDDVLDFAINNNHNEIASLLKPVMDKNNSGK